MELLLIFLASVCEAKLRLCKKYEADFNGQKLSGCNTVAVMSSLNSFIFTLATSKGIATGFQTFFSVNSFLHRLTEFGDDHLYFLQQAGK